jgi:transcriptional regulator with XRE-family HTH domain
MPRTARGLASRTGQSDPPREKDVPVDQPREPAIGPRVRAARLERGLSVAQLAREATLTKGFISQLERGLANPSVASLVRLCEALGIAVGSLFDPAHTRLVRAGERPQINFGGENVAEWLLTPASERRLQVIESRIEPGGGAGSEAYSHAGDAEFVHVISGELEVRVEEDIFRLCRGDSLCFTPRTAHTWRNPSAKRDAHVLWVLTPAI